MAIINEGLQYHLFIDPFLDRVHSMAANMIEPGSKVIDIACGNGTFAFKMAENAGHVTGIDLSEGSIEFAFRRARKRGLENVSFLSQDANDLSAYSDSSFDCASISMAVHQFSPVVGQHILKQMARIARSIIVIDYSCPQPDNFNGLIVRIIERIAGKEHFSHFNAYQHRGGIEGIFRKMKLSASVKVETPSRIFSIYKLEL